MSDSSSGIGFCGLLAIVFITLKLTKVIDWSWWWVLAPLWVPIAIILVVLIVIWLTVFFAELTIWLFSWR